MLFSSAFYLVSFGTIGHFFGIPLLLSFPFISFPLGSFDILIVNILNNMMACLLVSLWLVLDTTVRASIL